MESGFVVWLAEGRFEMSFREPGGVDEERRLYGHHPAKDELTLTLMLHRQRDQSQVLLRRSRFVEEQSLKPTTRRRWSKPSCWRIPTKMKMEKSYRRRATI